MEFKLKDSSQSVNVSKGESVTASENGLSEKTTFDPAEELKSWEAITGKTIESAGDIQADTIQETAEPTDKTQDDAIQELLKQPYKKLHLNFQQHILF